MQEKCPSWCDYAEHSPHTGLHVHRIGEVLLGEDSPSYVVAVTIESEANDPQPVITLAGRYDISYGSARLTWTDADLLAGMLVDARKRYG